jgi:hypothetical protein
MQLTNQNHRFGRDETVANLARNMDSAADCRYLSQDRISHEGSFVRRTEWIVAAPVSLSKS